LSEGALQELVDLLSNFMSSAIDNIELDVEEGFMLKGSSELVEGLNCLIIIFIFLRQKHPLHID
jgi:hypothetical protein